MSVEDSIIHFFSMINNRDLERFGDVLTERTEFYFPKTQPLLGKNQIIRFFNILFHRYPELKFRIHRKIVQGQTAAVHWTNHGMNRRGDHYENEGVTVFEMDGDQIRFISDFFKDTEKF